jgi:adenine-specific DNA-methyltransferase
MAEFEDLDELTNGLLINSENFQALNLLQDRYQKEISAIYGDPPYNAKSSEIIYKNSFKHSSWISFMYDRVNYASNLKTSKGAIITAIDENEVFNLMKTYDVMFPEWNKTVVTVLHNPAGVQGDNFSYSHEYAVFMFENFKHVIGKAKREKETIEPFRDWGPSGTRNPMGSTFYPIYVDLQGEKIIGFGDACTKDFHPGSQNIIKDTEVEIYPVGDEGDERKWVFARETVEDIADELFVSNNNGVFQVMRTKSKGSYKTVWTDSLYYANIYGSKLLNNIIGEKVFDFPKSVFTVKDCIFSISEIQKGNSIILDYFAGSGTTGHAVIKLNREDDGNRKYILVEMGTYFNTVTKPRMQKVIYSDNWKNGKPQDKKGISQMFKYMVLESYEDALNNLTLQQTQTQQGALALNNKVAEEYLLQYMLDVESQDHLFNLNAFKNPFAYQLNVTENNELVPTTVDLVETFNYLIGIKVQKVERIKEFKLVTGENLSYLA